MARRTRQNPAQFVPKLKLRGVPPLGFDGTAEQAMERLRATLASFPEARIVRAEGLVLEAVFTTPAGFKDEVVFRVDPALKRVDGFVLVVFAIGLFTSARIAEQVRSGIQALPRGQRYAGMAMGFTTFQTYRYVLLPMAFRIIIPPLTSETMNVFKNSSVAFAVSVAELTMFAMQAQEETARGVEVYLAVTALYVISAFIVNRIMTFIEKRSRVPGMIAASGGGH